MNKDLLCAGAFALDGRMGDKVLPKVEAVTTSCKAEMLLGPADCIS